MSLWKSVFVEESVRISEQPEARKPLTALQNYRHTSSVHFMPEITIISAERNFSVPTGFLPYSALKRVALRTLSSNSVSHV